MRSLSRIQNIIIVIGAVAVIICCLFPPWAYTSKEKPAGYSLLTNPPAPKMTRLRSGDNRIWRGVKIDASKWLLQIVIIFITTVGGVLIIRDQQKMKCAKH